MTELEIKHCKQFAQVCWFDMPAEAVAQVETAIRKNLKRIGFKV